MLSKKYLLLEKFQTYHGEIPNFLANFAGDLSHVFIIHILTHAHV